MSLSNVLDAQPFVSKLIANSLCYTSKRQANHRLDFENKRANNEFKALTVGADAVVFYAWRH
ncbi:hypothetical protein T12_1006 [Trichinella patagoniensis]|uniref:Uncharacterized protein n=1 Tax=Trichinella patagoniensis TaxID=990121 RepID=A0A0V0ZF94_9BILA|nr:hypothetical protein T12_1006 [Trichinella patagoniensis]